MKTIKIAAGFAHVDYGHIADLVKAVDRAGCDYIHADAADMHDLKNMQLMGGWQVIEGMRPCTKKPIECHIYTRTCDKIFADNIARAGANMLILPAEHFLGASLSYLITYCRGHKMKFGLTLGCYTPLSFVEESIYDIDRLHIVTHGVDDGSGAFSWRRSVLDLIDRAKNLIAQKNPACELAVDGGLRESDMAEIIRKEPDVVILSSAIFKHPDGAEEGVKSCRRTIEQALANGAV
ncbi:MAG: pentose-5-phosphate 3-epimerase [Spirochaetota bacterium]